MTLRLGVVLPTYNERNNLRGMVERLDKALGDIAWEAIIVDDNSPDGTSDEARALAQEDGRVRVLQRIGRRGLSSAAIEGMCATAAPVVAVMDADHQHDPELLPQMLAAIESGEYDMSYASRFAEGASTEEWGRPDRVKASGIANAIARKVTGVELTDPMSGYFMLRAETLRADAHRLSGVGFKILLDILATVDAPLRVKEFPLNFAARAEGESKLDRTVVFEFLVGLYDKWLGRWIPTRFALFGTIGGLGVVVHMAVLAVVLGLYGEAFAVSHYPKEAAFIAGQIPAAVTWEPHLSLVREKKQGKVLIDSSQTPGLIVDVVDLTCDYIKNNPKDVEAFVKGLYKAVEFIKTNPDEAYAVMAKGVGGYLEKPADFADAAKGVRFYDQARNVEFFGTPEKGEAKDLMAMGNKIWGGFQKMKMDIGYNDLIDLTFVNPK